MSMHIACSGFTGEQRALVNTLNSNENAKECDKKTVGELLNPFKNYKNTELPVSFVKYRF
jgi:hypothetical protein